MGNVGWELSGKHYRRKKMRIFLITVAMATLSLFDAQEAAAADSANPLADAKRCAAVTPLPDDLSVEVRGENVQPDIANFLGVWSGSWNGEGCGTLAVTSVETDGTADVIYSWDPKWGTDLNPMT